MHFWAGINKPNPSVSCAARLTGEELQLLPGDSATLSPYPKPCWVPPQKLFEGASFFGWWPLVRAARREPTTGLTVGPGTLGGGLRAGNMRQSPDGPQRGEESAGEPQSAGNRARTPVRGDEPLVPVVPAVRGSSAQVTCRSPWPRKCRGKRMLMLD